jgi:hypothetical protein
MLELTLGRPLKWRVVDNSGAKKPHHRSNRESRSRKEVFERLKKVAIFWDDNQKEDFSFYYLKNKT